MVVGTTLMKLNGDPYYSPQFSRGGLSAVFSVTVEQLAGSGFTFDIDVEHRNADDTAWTSAGTFATINSPGTYTHDISAIKEQVRFKYTVGGSAATAAVHFLMTAPSWRPY